MTRKGGSGINITIMTSPMFLDILKGYSRDLNIKKPVSAFSAKKGASDVRWSTLPKSFVRVHTESVTKL